LCLAEDICGMLPVVPSLS